jgi:hypothetical protein
VIAAPEVPSVPQLVGTDPPVSGSSTVLSATIEPWTEIVVPAVARRPPPVETRAPPSL